MAFLQKVCDIICAISVIEMRDQFLAIPFPSLSSCPPFNPYLRRFRSHYNTLAGFKAFIHIAVIKNRYLSKNLLIADECAAVVVYSNVRGIRRVYIVEGGNGKARAPSTAHRFFTMRSSALTSRQLPPPPPPPPTPLTPSATPGRRPAPSSPSLERCTCRVQTLV